MRPISLNKTPANIYRPSLGKVWFDRPNPKQIQPLNFQEKKKTFYLELYALQRTEAGFSILISIYLKKKVKMIKKK